MKTFTVVDLNDPERICIDCVGCSLERKKNNGQVTIFTSAGTFFPVAPPMIYPLAVLLQRKVAEAAIAGGMITIPPLEDLNDDELRVAIEDIKVE